MDPTQFRKAGSQLVIINAEIKFGAFLRNDWAILNQILFCAWPKYQVSRIIGPLVFR